MGERYARLGKDPELWGPAGHVLFSLYAAALFHGPKRSRPLCGFATCGAVALWRDPGAGSRPRSGSDEVGAAVPVTSSQCRMRLASFGPRFIPTGDPG